MAQPGEPSVEEILDSIKKVIARDNRAGAAEQRRSRESRGIPSPEPEADELEDDVLDLGEAAEFVDDDYVPEDYVVDGAIEGAEDDASAASVPLIGEGPRSSMRESLAMLAMLAEPPAAPQIVRSGETSLEGLVRDMLRPMLAEWLDQHLPPVVDALVAAEIARIVGKKG
jgi:uncharacterized protein